MTTNEKRPARNDPIPPRKSGDPGDPERRRLLMALATVVGAPTASRIAGGGAALATALSWAAASRDDDYVPESLTGEHMDVLAAICTHVIPATDVPGAEELGVHEFVDHFLRHAESRETRERSRAVIEALDRRSRERHGAPFVQLEPPRQRELLEDLEAPRNGFGPDEKWPFKKLKDLVVFGYCTTEAGATQLLAWDPMPGGFRGSVPYESIGKAWYS